MLKLIIYKELREIIGSTKFAVTFGVCSLLIIFSFYTGAREYQIAQEEYNAALNANLGQFEGLTEWGEVSGFQISLPPQPLAALVMGVSNDMGRAISINPGSVSASFTSNDSRYSQNPAYAAFRFLDLEFIFQIVFSLFAILFAYDAINGEKERGTLRLTFANSLPRASYIGGKVIGSFLALTIPLLVPILIGALLLLLMGIVFTGEEWIRLVLIVTTGFLYLGVFLTLSVFVSALTQRSSSAFLLLLVIWVFSVLIIPRVSVILAGNVVQVTQTEELDLELAQLSREYLAHTLTEMNKYAMANMPKSEPGESPEIAQSKMLEFINSLSEQSSVLYADYAKDIKNLTGRFFENRSNLQNEQRQLAYNIARISPAAAFSFSATTLSGTSLDLKSDYIEQATAFQESYGKFSKEKRAGEVASIIVIRGAAAEVEKPKEIINLQEIPVFQFKGNTLSEVVEDSLLDIALLIFFNLIFFSGSFIAFLRYDLR